MKKVFLYVFLIAGAAMTLQPSGPARAAGEHEGGHGATVGEPAESTEPDRTVEITAADTMTFEPSTIRVGPGEVVRFVITNTGTLPHSFTIGSDEWHQHHEDEMQGMDPDNLIDHMRDEPNGIVVPPGESRELTWRFADGGQVLFGCHVPGHFPAGMKGEIRITP